MTLHPADKLPTNKKRASNFWRPFRTETKMHSSQNAQPDCASSETKTQTYPEVIATATRGRSGQWTWTIAKCKFCGMRHLHGGGDGPRPSGGHRVAHCDVPGRPSGYELVEAP
jgi:hypothetical protein